MLDPSADDHIDHLLAEGRLAGPTKDRILNTVLERVERSSDAREAGDETRARGRWRFWTGGFVLLAGAAAAWLLIPRSPGVDLDGGLRPKGPIATNPTPKLDVVCSGAALGACPVGGTLVFGVSDGDGGFLAAYAEPGAGVGTGERIWYFSKEGESPRLAAGDGAHAATRAIRVGPEHAPGDYQLHLFLTRTPLGRAQLLAAKAGGAGPGADVIARRDLALRVVKP